ncbi:hypothetical protein EJ06DRAFT_412405 [Trichodelitschia bisporula]|uniref:Glycosyltransferase family 8 protein n=1 Tax=Trichodelitschia bisporula TaxID=703511 RepID=A0A6G1HYS9_9PEZI|nr:hypothetical protein EJ06DRAFT_412405 [Trichodelitschia bisporula]
MLLTQSQVSVLMSSGIILTFTTLLFLTGYLHQQRTLSALHSTLKPTIPPPNVQYDPLPRHRGSAPLLPPASRAQLQSTLTTHSTFDWTRVAYAQLAASHGALCHTLLLFADLHRLKSPAARLLLFPRIWVTAAESDYDPEIESAKRLLKKASRRFRAVLVPVDPIVGGDPLDPESYSALTLFSLTAYERIISLPTPGLVTHAPPLDTLLTTPPSQPALAGHDEPLLLTPSVETHAALTKAYLKSPRSLPALLASLYPSSADPLSNLSTTTGALRALTPQEPFNATAYLESVSYIRFSDPELPSPEYEVPYAQIVDLRPKDEDQGFLWESLRGVYKTRRYEVCGLDLEVWNEGKKGAVREHETILGEHHGKIDL